MAKKIIEMNQFLTFLIRTYKSQFNLPSVPRTNHIVKMGIRSEKISLSLLMLPIRECPLRILRFLSFFPK